MKSARCLLHLQCLRLLEQSTRSAVQCAPLLQSASSSQPSVLHKNQHQLLRPFHSSAAWSKPQPAPVADHKTNKSLVVHDDLFERVAKDVKVKATFNKVVDVFLSRDVRRRGHVEFIYAALRKMPEFGVEADLAVYNKLLDVFPKEVFVPTNFIQRMFNHYPRQQECGVQLLEQMEEYGVMPNVETKVLLLQIFGKKAHPTRKYQRMLYWMPKFKHLNPYPVPQHLPEDPVDLARLSLTRVASDLDAKVTVYQLPCTDITEAGEEITLPHVVGIQSPSQMELLAKHDPSRPVFVEGPFPLWLKDRCVHYYVLRADPPEEKVEEPYDPERSFYYPLRLDVDFGRDLGDEETFDVEDLDEGPVFAMCMTGQADQAALNQWISGLQENNPMLGRVPTLFRLNAEPRELLSSADAESGRGPDADTQREEVLLQRDEEPGNTVEEEPQRRRQSRNQ